MHCEFIHISNKTWCSRHNKDNSMKMLKNLPFPLSNLKACCGVILGTSKISKLHTKKAIIEELPP